MARPMQQENKNFFSLVKFDSHKIPVFREAKDKDWIIYGADDREFNNRYPEYLLQLYNRSSKNNALINGIVHYAAGNGVEVDYLGLDPVKRSELADFLKKPNPHGETIADIMYRCSLDKKIFGGFYLEIVWNKSGSDFDYYHMDYTKLRRAKDEDGWYYSEDWKKSKQDERSVEEGGTGYKFIPDFNGEKAKNTSQIYAYKDYRPALKYYPLPDWIGAVPYAEIDYEISNYWLNGIKSGFNAGTIISFNQGKPTDEQKQQIERALKAKFTGTDRANSLLINYSQNKDSAPTIEHLQPSDFDKTFNLLNEAVQNELYTGHRITNPILFGVKTPGQLGSKDEMVESYELFKSTYIEPFQKIMNDEFNYILSFKNFDARIKLKEARPISVDYLRADDLKDVLTIKEKRIMAQKVYPDVVTDIEAKDPEPPAKQVSSAVHRFGELTEEEFAKKQKDAVAVFKKYGKPKAEFEFQSSKPLYFIEHADFQSAQTFADLLDNENLKEIYKAILTAVNENPLADEKEIAKAIKQPVAKVKKAMQVLIDEGAIEVSRISGAEGKIEKKIISDKAESYINDNPADIGAFSIMYSYEPRPGLKDLLPTSRQFCVDLVDANLLYTREDIESVSNEVGWDTWKYRGGFWRHKGSKLTTPYCRHIWMQHVVKKK